MSASISETLFLTSADRVLVIAPHPDDESIACGGFLLAARDAGAARRVVTLTDGDNNPWPQRWIEKRWRIDTAARVRWGARRRAESQNALDVLGVAASERVFLGFPDTSLTSFAMRDANRLVAPLREQIAQFEPTVVAFPALTDRHPDHSAAHIAVRFALLGVASLPRQLVYRVHGEGDPAMSRIVELDESRRSLKRDAIACHRTQMALSGKRFLAFATSREAYGEVFTIPRDDHPLTATVRRDGVLALRVRKQNLHGNRRVSVLFGGASGVTHAWQLALPARERACDVRDARDERIVATVEWRSAAEVWELELPLAAGDIPDIGFVKLARPRPGLVVFDRYGWQAVDYEKFS